ncbi:MAG: putative toxin-antitoxin system toxin component, PIN family [Desulfurivibrionaceae bacterium]|nr:putative toxin-antitoxin system toxin component, PIN family [Desulfobacterales bacterium]MDT8335787.1 putative toxin-antitoxin system toxin component, PIN family [Desulfurivibrionaceae bacterium]
MKIVLDTNILVSGLLTPFGTSGEIIRMVSSGQLSLCYDARILTEYRDVLLRPRFQFNHEHSSSLLYYIQHAGQVYPTQPLPNPLPDPDDEPFLEVAIAGKASCLITGNKVHFPKSHLQGMKVFSPTDFLRYWGKRNATEQSH